MTHVLPFTSFTPATAATPEFADRRLPGRVVTLTGQQRTVLALLCEGKSNKLIARDLGIACSTVKVHVSAILRALDVSNRTEAVVLTRRLDLHLQPRHAAAPATHSGGSVQFAATV